MFLICIKNYTQREFRNSKTLRVFVATVSNRVVYAETSKNEDTWYGMLWHCNAKYDSAWRVIQWAVAQKSGMPQSVIARIESGDRGISVDTLGRIAHTLGKEVQLV